MDPNHNHLQHAAPMPTNAAARRRIPPAGESTRPDTKPTTPEYLTEWPVVHAYTRAEALADGVLVDVTSAGREAGFKVPTAVTATVFDECIEWTESDAEQSGAYQDQKGRLWDVVFLAALRARTLAARGERQNQVIFQLDVVPRPGRTQRRCRTLKLVIGPGDNHEPVATIMLPDED